MRKTNRNGKDLIECTKSFKDLKRVDDILMWNCDVYLTKLTESVTNTYRSNLSPTFVTNIDIANFDKVRGCREVDSVFMPKKIPVMEYSYRSKN